MPSILEDSDEAKEVVKEVFFIFFGRRPSFISQTLVVQENARIECFEAKSEKKGSIQDHRQLEFFPNRKSKNKLIRSNRVRKEDKIG